MARNRARLAALGVAGILTAGATVTALTPAIAQTATETPSETTTKEQRHAERQAAFAAALAEELDLPADRVQAAVEKVHTDMRAAAKAERLANLKTRLDAKVADGSLTQEQADAIYAAAESGAWPEGGRGRGGHRHGGPRGGAAPAPADGEAAPASA